MHTIEQKRCEKKSEWKSTIIRWVFENSF